MRFIFFRLTGKSTRQGVYNLGVSRLTHPDRLIFTDTFAGAFLLLARVVVLERHIFAVYRHLSLTSLIPPLGASGLPFGVISPLLLRLLNRAWRERKRWQILAEYGVGSDVGQSKRTVYLTRMKRYLQTEEQL